MIKPTSVEDAREITETLLSGRTVILNLEGLDLEIAQRIIDFTSGATFAISGNLQKISNYIFLVTPTNVDISGDLQDLLNTSLDSSIYEILVFKILIMNKEESMLQNVWLNYPNWHITEIVIFSDFLNLNELNILHTTPKDMFLSKYETYGGYDLAERQMVAFLPDALYYDYDYPNQVIEVTPSSKRFAEDLTHRDYLGAIMNLGIERSKVGDIIVKDQKGLFLSKRRSRYIY